MPFLLFSRPGVYEFRVPGRPGRINYVRFRLMFVGPQNLRTYNSDVTLRFSENVCTPTVGQYTKISY